jgi:endonuclease/exonuclease/phosphatase family metal-dependent hydrolase
MIRGLLILTLLLAAGCSGGEPVRFAAYNASLYRDAPGKLVEDLSTPDDEQARAVAEVIQTVRPDVLLVNEFDYDEAGRAADLFRQNYLRIGQNGLEPIDYPHVYVAPSNTGTPSGHDLNNDGTTGGDIGTRDYGNDALGYGTFPGQYAFILLSKHPIDHANIRTFQDLLWKDLPGNHIPPGFYTDEELAVLPLSSKNHADIPVTIGETTVHVLASHPTPPGFDGDEDRNGRRNYDEVGLVRAFFKDIGVRPTNLPYVEWSWCGTCNASTELTLSRPLASDASFVILGDLNADPADGSGFRPQPVMPGDESVVTVPPMHGDLAPRPVDQPTAIGQLLDHPRINGDLTPTSPGGTAAARRQGGRNATHTGDPAADTADFSDTRGPGNLRVDYALPSRDLKVEATGIHWPAEGSALETVERASDHRLVWVDVLVK